MITLTRVSKIFGAKSVLKDVSFSIAPGEIVGFVGANGSGKTTTMRAVMGLLPISGGEIEIDRSIVGRDKQASRILGYLPEERGLYMNDSVQSQILFFGELHGMSRSLCQERSDYLLERLGIGHYKYSILRDLSLGNQQRVQVAVAALHSPKYLILDEPFSGLDPSGIRSIKSFIREECEQGVGAVISSHILPYLEEISTKILILNNGEIYVHNSSTSPLVDYFEQLEVGNA